MTYFETFFFQMFYSMTLILQGKKNCDVQFLSPLQLEEVRHRYSWNFCHVSQYNLFLDNTQTGRPLLSVVVLLQGWLYN